MKRKVFYVSSDGRDERHEHCVTVYHDDYATEDEVDEVSFNAAMGDAFARGEWFEYLWSSPAPSWSADYDAVEYVDERQHYSA